MQETRVRSLGWEDPLEKEMATQSSTLAWKIPWTEEPGRLQSMGSLWTDWETSLSFHFTLPLGFPCGSAGKESAHNAGDLDLIPGLGRFPWRRERLPIPVFWPGEFYGLYSPWDCKELDTTERLALWVFHFTLPLVDEGGRCELVSRYSLLASHLFCPVLKWWECPRRSWKCPQGLASRGSKAS